MSVKTPPKSVAASRPLRRARRALGPPAPLRASSRLIAISAVALITLIAIPLHLSELHFHYWVDEGISVGIASHPLSELPHLLREDGSPPLYYLLLHVWMQAFGRGEVATHDSLPDLCADRRADGLLGRQQPVRPPDRGVLPVLAAAVPFLTSYAQETRMYSLLLLFSLIVATSFLHAFVFRRRRYLPVFAVSMAASLYTHNWALFLGAGHLRRLSGLRPADAAGRSAGAVARRRVGLWSGGRPLFPWVPTLLYQAQHTGAPWALPPILWSLTRGLYFIVGGRGAAVAILFGAGVGLLAVRAAGPGDRRQPPGDRRWRSLASGRC